jgi:hypothetical protein
VARPRAVGRLVFMLVVLAGSAGLAGCGGAASSGGGGTASATGSTTSGGPTGPSDGATGTDPGGGDPGTTSREPLPEVTSTVAGSAVAGNSGGVGPGQTDRFSEAVRLENGSCVGWAGPGTGTWTQGLAEGARITLLDATSGARIGSGRLGRSEATDVDPNGNGQWTCSFPFSATVRGAVPAVFRIKVAALPPMTARRDPSRPGLFVASVSTVADPKVISACDGTPAADTGLWPGVVGQYWSDGLSQICSAGVGIAKVERTCRPRTIGSDRVVAVLAGDDPKRVYEDAAGLKVTDVAELGPAPTVLVRVANGQPCS